MAIQNEFFGFEVKDKTTGLPLSGALVELRKGATIYTLTEVASSAYYTINSIPTGKYSVFIDSVDTNQTMAVGSGQLAALGNEVDNIPVSTATEYAFQDPATYKATIELDQVTNVAVPDPTASDANKVIGVDDLGNYELKTISTSGFDTIFEVTTTAGLREALEAEFDAKLICLNRKTFNFVNAQQFDVWGSCSIILGYTSQPFQWLSNGVTATFDYKAGADVSDTSIQFLNGTVAFGSPADYVINVPWKITNWTIIGTPSLINVSGSSAIVYEYLDTTLPTGVTVSTSQEYWQNSNKGSAPSLQDVTDQGSTTTNSITAAGVISSTDLFQSSSANVSLGNNTLGGVTFYGATSELNSTGGALRLGNSLVPIEQQFLKATDKGAVYTGLKMLAKDTTTNEVFMADVPSVGGSQDLQEVTEIGRSTNQGVQLLELQSSFAAPYSNDSELFTQAGSDAPPSEWIGSVTQIAGYIGAGAQFTGGSIISTTGVNEDVQGFFGCSFWLRVDQNTGGDNEQVLSHYDPVNDVDFRFFEYGNTLGMAVRDGGSFPKNWAVQTSGTYSSLVGTGWHHVMGWMSMDGSDVKLYIDGVLQTNYQFVQPLVVQNPTYTQRGVGGNTSGSEILSGISVSNVYTSVDPQFANEVSTYYAQGQAPDLLLYSVAGVLKGKENGIEFNLNSPNITQDLETTLAEGNTTGDNKVTFETHTNGSPTNGDVWYDGTNLQVQSATLQVSGQTLVGANYLDLEDSTGWGVRIDGSNNALRPIVNLDTGLGLSSRQFNSLYLGGLTDNGTTTTGKKMLVRDTTTGATEVADVPGGASGTFTSNDGKTITVTNGLITSIV